MILRGQGGGPGVVAVGIGHVDLGPVGLVGSIGDADVGTRSNDLVGKGDRSHTFGVGHLGTDDHRILRSGFVRCVIDLSDVGRGRNDGCAVGSSRTRWGWVTEGLGAFQDGIDEKVAVARNPVEDLNGKDIFTLLKKGGGSRDQKFLVAGLLVISNGCSVSARIGWVVSTVVNDAGINRRSAKNLCSIEPNNGAVVVDETEDGRRGNLAIQIEGLSKKNRGIVVASVIEIGVGERFAPAEGSLSGQPRGIFHKVRSGPVVDGGRSLRESLAVAPVRLGCDVDLLSSAESHA